MSELTPSSPASVPAEAPARPALSADVLAALLTQTLISAGTYLAAKRAMDELSPLTLVLWRALVSAPTYVLLLVLLGVRLTQRA